VITIEQIRGVISGAVTQLGEAGADAAPEATAASQVSPGLGLRHYAPRARLLLVEWEGADQAGRFAEQARQAEGQGETVGLMLPGGFPLPALKGARVFDWGDWNDPESLARRLFAGLRFLDAEGATAIVCPMPPEEGIGIAIRDRLRKAARR
jgi:L-threonylcarbamoyladenylate synthase